MTSTLDETPTLRKAKYAISKGSMIGEGAFRRVFRTRKSKWVYKVDYTSACAGSWGTNGKEIEQYHKFRADFTGIVRFPEMRMVGNNIVAAEYIKGSFPAYCGSLCCECQEDELFEGECWYPIVIRETRNKIEDIHASNVIIGDDGYIYIIDLGV